MSTPKKPLDQMSERELLETQVRLLSRIRSNTSNTLTLIAVVTALVVLGGIVMAMSG
jgi:hypothetical protein